MLSLPINGQGYQEMDSEKENKAEMLDYMASF